jgi:hypothetical protein
LGQFEKISGCYDKFVCNLENFLAEYKTKCYYKIININNISGTPKQNIHALVSEDFRCENYGNNLEVDLSQKIIAEF